MLSWTKSPFTREIARVDGGEKNKRILYIDSQFKPDEINEITTPLEYLGREFFKGKNKRMSQLQLNKLQNHILSKSPPIEPDLLKIYNDAMNKLKHISKTEVRLNTGKFVPLPNKDIKVANNYYVTGKTGSGKSYYTSGLIKEIKKKHKNLDVILFSRLAEDKPLDKHNPVRIPLDETLLEKPIDINELRKSIVVFDDTESLTNKKVLKVVENLRDQLINTGRHEKMYVIICNHLPSDYNKTRAILAECQPYTIFPQMMSPHLLKTFLTKYAGMTNAEIEKVKNLPTRWCTIYTNWPSLCLYETGAFLLNGKNDGSNQIMPKSSEPKNKERLEDLIVLDDSDDSDDSDGTDDVPSPKKKKHKKKYKSESESDYSSDYSD